MKLINDEGKILGKINVIDLGFIIAIIIVVLMLFLNADTLKEANQTSGESAVTEENKETSGEGTAEGTKTEIAKIPAYISMVFNNLDMYMVNSFKVGDKLVINKEISEDTYIEEVVVKPSYINLFTPDGRIKRELNPYMKDVYIKIRTMLNEVEPIRKKGVIEFRIGVKYFINTKYIDNLGGIIYDIG